MGTDNRKPENSNTRTDKQDEKLGDLPTKQYSDKDAEQVKGGRPTNVKI